jgi:hypothetical protein
MPSLDRSPRTEASSEEQPPEELQGEQIVDLPSREALSVVDPGAFGFGIPMPLGQTAGEPPAAADTPDAAVPET